MTTATPKDRASRRGLLAYLGLTVVLSWAPAALLGEAWTGAGLLSASRLLTCSLFYALCMGWQPLVATWVVRRWIDPPGYLDQGLKPSPGRFLVLAGIAPLVLAVAATLLAWLAGCLGAPALGSTGGAAQPTLALQPGSWMAALGLALACMATVALIWSQSLGEEIGWRGFFMTRLMQHCGAWKGLFLHGVVWGLWYAPIFLFGNDDFAGPALRSAAFVLTCCLLGVLLGWLRLASGSIIPTTVANAVLTLTAGLPFLLQGIDVGLLGSAYGPPGWVPMALAIAILATGRWRGAVVTPSALPRRREGLWFALDARAGGAGPRVLH